MRLSRPGQRRSLRRAFFVFVAVASSLPSIALACPVCRDPRDDNQAAFLSMTIFMSLLPLGLIGGLVGYLYRAYNRDDETTASSTGLESTEGGQS